MTDTRLRQLERRFKETGTVEDEAAWLKARVRVGDLSRFRLRLAAFLGHPGAVLALARSVVADEITWSLGPGRPVAELVHGLREWGHEAMVRAAVAAAHVALPWHELEHDATTAQEALRAAERWILCPCRQCARAASEAGRAANDSQFHQLAWAASGDERSNWAGWFVGYAARTTDDGQIRAAILCELVPWALGYSDPVRDRVVARLREASGE